jgi:hypothetical protein
MYIDEVASCLERLVFYLIWIVFAFNVIKNIDKESLDYTVYPNPANEKLYFSFNNVNTKVYYVSILNIVGKAVMMLPRPDWQNGIDISNLSKGTYLIQLIDDETKSTTIKKFVKE